jgi:hypothetical protein
VLGAGGNVSKAARSPAAWRRNNPHRRQGWEQAGSRARWIADPGKGRLTIGTGFAPSGITAPFAALNPPAEVGQLFGSPCSDGAGALIGGLPTAR